MASPMDRKSFKKPTPKLYVLDEDFYPDCWKDNKLMSVFLDTFRPRQVNEEHYNQKMKFWIDMIESYCEYKGSSKCSISELEEAFKRNGTKPYCLEEVFNQMQSNGTLVSKDEFMQQPKSLTGWAVDSLFVKPLSWGFGKLKETLVSTKLDDKKIFVSTAAVMSQSQLLLEHIRHRKVYNNIISMDDLMDGADDIEGISRDGILVVLHHLSTNDKKVYIEEHKDGTPDRHKLLLKFAEPHQNVDPITDMERSIYNLEQTEKFLIQTIDKKEEELDGLLKKVKECLKDGKKNIAKTYLRKKHLMEADLAKSVNVLENIQTMLQRMNGSKSDKEILATYKIGSDAIKNAFAESGVNLDNVQDIIEEMREVYEDQEDIESAISEPMRGYKDIDDADLEKELNDLISSNDVDKNTNNSGGIQKPEQKKIDEMEQLDRELELRLKRLRTDLSTLDDPKSPVKAAKDAVIS